MGDLQKEDFIRRINNLEELLTKEFTLLRNRLKSQQTRLDTIVETQKEIVMTETEVNEKLDSFNAFITEIGEDIEFLKSQAGQVPQSVTDRVTAIGEKLAAAAALFQKPSA